MFKSRIIVTPLDSEAVVHLEWNSVEQIVYFRYLAGDTTYDLQGITYERFAHLCSEAHRLGSWGSALHYWKKEAIEHQAAERKREFLAVWNGLDAVAKADWLAWIGEEDPGLSSLSHYANLLKG